MSRATQGPPAEPVDQRKEARTVEAPADGQDQVLTPKELKELKERRSVLRAEVKEARDGPIEHHAEVYAQYQEVQGQVQQAEVGRRQAKWDELTADLKVKPSATYESHFIHGSTPVEEMKEVVRLGQSLQQPDSELKLRGNEVDPLTRGEIWSTKMEKLEDVASRPKHPNGEPRSVDAEYYELASQEMLDKLSRSAKGGANVRVLIDPGHISGDSKQLDATSLATRLGAVKQLQAGSGDKAGVALFASRRNMGARTELMHRKLLRTDDEVVFGGMNANPGSSENVDFGMTIKGPAANELGRVFEDDVKRSSNADVEAIYGDQIEMLRNDERPVHLRPRGLMDLLEAQDSRGPQPRKTRDQRIDGILERARYKGINPAELVDLPPGTTVEKFLKRDLGSAALTDKGRELLASDLESTIKGLNSPKNQERLLRHDVPSAEVAGRDTVSVGDTPAERQALMLHAIDTAESHIKMSTFVLTEDIARLLAEKKERMEAAGKPFKVEVVMDPGVYGYGGTPNERGYKMLEDKGIDVKWAVLDRTETRHDRKVHAKMMVTDKMMLGGSTNFSNKGLRHNWELTDIVFFGEDDPSSLEKQKEVEGDFDRLYNKQAMSLNTIALAEQRYADEPQGPTRDLLVDKYRSRSMMAFLRGIDNYERQIGSRVEKVIQNDPTLRFDLNERVQAGQSRGYAVLDLLGEGRMRELRESSPAYARLLQFEGPAAA